MLSKDTRISFLYCNSLIEWGICFLTYFKPGDFFQTHNIVPARHSIFLDTALTFSELLKRTCSYFAQLLLNFPFYDVISGTNNVGTNTMWE